MKLSAETISEGEGGGYGTQKNKTKRTTDLF